MTLLARMVTQKLCNLAARNSSISRDVADLTVHYCRDALANPEEVGHGNEERRRQAETAARFREQVDTRLSNLRESIERDEERRQKATRKEVDAAERRKKEQQQEEEHRQKEMREGMKEMKEAMMEMKAKMKEMKDGMVNQIVGRLSAVLREESERQKKARQEDEERRQQQDAKRKQVADDEERQKKKQLDEQWRKAEEEKRKDVEATERQRKKKHQEEERRQKEVEAGMKEVMEAVKEMKTGMKGWKEGMLKQQRQLEAKTKAMDEETERLAREMEEEDLTMQGEGTWKGVEEEIAEGLGSLLLIESGEANVAEGVAIVPGQNVEVSRRRPRQEDREPEGHAAKRRRAAGIQELIPIIPREKKGMKIDKCDNRKNAVVDDKGKTLGVCLPFRGSRFSQQGEGALQKWTSEQTVGGRKRNLGSHNTVWERAYTVAVYWKFYFPDIDMQAYGMNRNRINKWREDLDFTTWLPTGVWSVINELHLDKPDGFSLVQTNTALWQQQGDGFQVAACAGVGITASQKMTQWERGATSATRGTSTAIASSAARSSTAATASSAASSSSAADVSSAILDALATLAASVACVAIEAMRSVKDQEHDKEAWILPLSDALLKALPAESRAAGDTKRMTRVVAKVVTSWCLCSMASRGLRQHQGVCLGVQQKKLGGRDTTTGADKEKKTKKSSAKGNATKDASTEENTGTGGQE
ncbi:unnamed protein product [Closterium sp. NIES-64]|nr:unnamed protein product [Closterium sp. NIES-64]